MPFLYSNRKCEYIAGKKYLVDRYGTLCLAATFFRIRVNAGE